MARTPGPWTFDPIAMNLIRGADGFAVATTSVATSNTENLYPTQRANARLIAAAPDLLDAAKAAGEWLSTRKNLHRDDEAFAVFSRIIAAVVKAEGQS